ncbi:MAG: ABC transporter ATP-binding protein [Nitrososphaerales archaeon]|nr:ABC transporter ATP-binding protein [Nitrososphaerales archaeon]
MAILEVKGLRVYFDTIKGSVKAVDNVSFDTQKGEALGIAGESGCGKTTTALAVMRLVPKPGKIVSGEIKLNGEDLVLKSEAEMRKVRSKKVSIAFQGSLNAFNPVQTIGKQIVEAIRTHEDVSKDDAWQRARKLLQDVGVDPNMASRYPHELSGGMKQRAMISMAMANNPDLLIADEPTTALDVIVQAQVLKLMRRVQSQVSMILISHDLSVIAEICNRVAIMYAGQIVEFGTSQDIFSRAAHPYTRGLLSAFPSVAGEKKHLEAIKGNPPDLLSPPSACRFHPRCPYYKDKCSVEDPPMVEVSPGHYALCHFAGEI